ncbi:MAG: ABC transporter ATP-binding protein, partial [Eubacterium sp.]|nr:ABC transporter ATP-binding protein [Eubacterium sp.]
LALIAAFSHTPRLLILDEPFVGLDPEAFLILKKQMQLLCAQGSSVLFSSHILDVVEKICSTITILKNGSAVYTGSAHNLMGEKGLDEIFMEVNEDDENTAYSFEK